MNITNRSYLSEALRFFFFFFLIFSVISILVGTNTFPLFFLIVNIKRSDHFVLFFPLILIQILTKKAFFIRKDIFRRSREIQSLL